MNNLLQDLFKNFLNNNNHNNVNNTCNNCTCTNNNSSDYPDVFFTRDKKDTLNTPHQTVPNGSIFNSLNMEQILSFFFNKPIGTKSSILSLLENFSPKISNLSSILSKKNAKKEQMNNSENIIDLSEYEIVN